ncbi:RICIN domain-containing protein [Nonomuraea candida]|uniref:RICIN domain-containing protein n=1 Tax=Nonomuraea candida TaxID=359159 RepID=UPI00146FDB47|nr:RICIN domain-containing protein [Nonomuraea candida]
MSVVFRRPLSLAAAVLSGVCLLLLGQPQATASASAGATQYGAGRAAAATQPYYFQSTATSQRKCVGLADAGSTANGTELVLWDCHLNPDQWWYFGNPLYSLMSYASGYPSGKCVGLANAGSTANGTRLVLWDCHLNPDQQWVVRGLSDGSFALVNRPSNKCVGLADRGSTANGTRLVLWDCHLNLDQRWHAWS